MIRGLLFDMGGTLDADGEPWFDRFRSAFAAAGITVDRDRQRAAFDRAERLAATDVAIATMGLDQMVERHLGWQLRYLATSGEAGALAPSSASTPRAEIARRFVDPIRAVALRNVDLLASLMARGFLLGVVSNGCGNVDRLCADLGYAAYCSVIVDSRRVGIEKPDPAIFAHAASCLGLPPAAIMMIGDSFDRDIRPARSIGMGTAWLQGADGRSCPDASLVDACLRTLSELPQVLEASARTVA